jgi:acid stress-induced BolA-like protein IbaG/YrbA
MVLQHNEDECIDANNNKLQYCRFAMKGQGKHFSVDKCISLTEKLTKRVQQKRFIYVAI